MRCTTRKNAKYLASHQENPVPHIRSEILELALPTRSGSSRFYFAVVQMLIL
jgi:hypothetical protein